MTKAGKLILSVTALSATAIVTPVGTRSVIEAISPLRSYVCDFRLISPATCNLPLAATTTRVRISLREADRATRWAYRERISACERAPTAKRRSGAPVPVRKCWHERLTSFVSLSSR